MECVGLGWNDVPDEGLVFGMGGGLGFTYLGVPGLTSLIYLVGRSSDLERDLIARIGAKVDLRETDEPAMGWDWGRRELQHERPVMMWADIPNCPP